MPEIKILSRDDEYPTGDRVVVNTRLAPNNSVVTDIICIKDDTPVKTITDRHLAPDVAIRKASEIADDYEIDVIYVQNDL
ncbi:hypothetical protein [Methylocapsa acidiphila]|uniref:hypothetical protein n=1 Tax=Methylocapsa acidiphila TaxID=133552 RepID=UPI00047AC3CF|nr:hypothetical protein [Methylocapsa acidiphila]